MCGIIGYIGKDNAKEILIDGLKRLEYRGYDSAGIAILSEKGIEIRRKKGKIVELEKELEKAPVSGQIGIGHTRWATHGEPSDWNAHPHLVGKVALVHNGIIENYLELKKELITKGRKFNSETDSEVIAHLIDEQLNNGNSSELAIRSSISRLKGAIAVVILIETEPDLIFAFKRASPLIVGLGKDMNIIASDIPAILPHTRQIIALEDEELAVLSKNYVKIKDSSGKPLQREMIQVSWSSAMAEKAGFKHFMLKEIFEQPRALTETIMGRVQLEKGLVGFDELSPELENFISRARQVHITACGTAYHAGLVGKHLIEQWARIPCFVEIASEFRYRKPLLDKETLVILVSQSGETADTLCAEEESKKLGAKTLAICNVLGSSLSRKADGVIYTRAGPEIGVASTKAFITQLGIFYLLAIYLSQQRNSLSQEERIQLLEELFKMPGMIEQTLELDPAIEEIARKYYQSKIFFYIARGINCAIALEGALKLKEISYIHAEGYPAGELKHGPIALIDNNATLVGLVPSNVLFPKIFSNLMEVKARQGKVIALGNKDQEDKLKEKSDELLILPRVRAELEPLILTPPLQLLAYHIAVLNGTDVDQPRNLAKSVTVE